MAKPNNSPRDIFGRARNPPAASEEDISDLVPEPVTADKAFRAFHGKFAYRGRYAGSDQK